MIYGKNKQLVIFDLDPAYKRADLDELLIPTELITLINHYHYPVVYYEALHKHFKEHLAPEVTKDHLRIAVGSQVLPSDLPIGLYLNEEYRLRVIVSEQPCTNWFRILKNSWKKAFCIVNAINGCDYVSKRL